MMSARSYCRAASSSVLCTPNDTCENAHVHLSEIVALIENLISEGKPVCRWQQWAGLQQALSGWRSRRGHTSNLAVERRLQNPMGTRAQEACPHLTFFRPPKVPMRASQRPLWPETPRYRDLPRVNALLLRRTYATISSCNHEHKS